MRFSPFLTAFRGRCSAFPTDFWANLRKFKENGKNRENLAGNSREIWLPPHFSAVLAWNSRDSPRNSWNSARNAWKIHVFTLFSKKTSHFSRIFSWDLSRSANLRTFVAKFSKFSRKFSSTREIFFKLPSKVLFRRIVKSWLFKENREKVKESIGNCKKLLEKVQFLGKFREIRSVLKRFLRKLVKFE